MSPKEIRDDYILYIGAGAVAAGGIISMFQALPLIVASIGAGLRDLRADRRRGRRAAEPAGPSATCRCGSSASARRPGRRDRRDEPDAHRRRPAGSSARR